MPKRQIISPRKRETVLLVDDVKMARFDFVQQLKDHNYNVRVAYSVNDAKRILKNDKNKIKIAILDIMMPSGSFSSAETKGGTITGLALGRWIKLRNPEITIIGTSTVIEDPEVISWFEEHTAGYIQGKISINNFLELLKQTKRSKRKPLRTFIVHGHDDKTKYELKNYLQNTLQLSEPVILHEQPGLGRTIIEKFENIADSVNLVFVLLTPDDIVVSGNENDEQKRRSRQNVIFEMGYFMGKMSRQFGRVILLYKGSLELPSDISGLEYIDISKGIEAAGEKIRRELQELL